MTTSTAALTRVQFHTLIAISQGHVSMPGPGIDRDLGTWRVHAPNGRAVTATVNSLIAKGYAQASTIVEHDRRKAVATAAGTEEISRRSGRGR